MPLVNSSSDAIVVVYTEGEVNALLSGNAVLKDARTRAEAQAKAESRTLLSGYSVSRPGGVGDMPVSFPATALPSDDGG